MSKDLDNFTMPVCKKCGTRAIFQQHDNGACGDPECCGEYREWVVVKCEDCGAFEKPEA